MAWCIVRQPDGKLAAFSEVVDNFTAYAMDEAEAVEFCVTEGLGEAGARSKVAAGIEDHKPWTVGTKGGGLDRWDASLTTVAKVHGKDELMSVLTTMGFEEYDMSGLDLVCHRDEDETSPAGPA